MLKMSNGTCLPRWTLECIEIFSFARQMELSTPLLMHWCSIKCHISRLDESWRIIENAALNERVHLPFFVTCKLIEFEFWASKLIYNCQWNTAAHIKPMPIKLKIISKTHITDLSDFKSIVYFCTSNRRM